MLNDSVKPVKDASPATSDAHAHAQALSNSVPMEQHKGFMGKAADELKDFGEGLFHGAIEAPVNGVVQIANHVSGAHLPELHLVDENDVDHTAGGMIGNFVGATADMVALTLATGGLGGAGVAATALRLGAVGVVYSGVLQPTDANSKDFWGDRAKSAAVGGLTFAAMGGASAGLDALGVLAAPAARSLGTSIGIGALTGASGGVAHSEANAIFKEGHILPTATEFFGDVATYVAFGAAFGAAGYAMERLNNPLERVKGTDSSITIYKDRAGNDIRIDAKLPPEDGYRNDFTSFKDAHGKWHGTGTDGGYSNIAPDIDHVQRNPDGSITLVDHNVTQKFSPGQDYEYHDAYQEEMAARDAASRAEAIRTKPTVVKDGLDSSRTFDYTGRLTRITGGVESDYQTGNVTYETDGSVKYATVQSDGRTLQFTKINGADSYRVADGDTQYTFNGTINTKATTADGKANAIEFKPANGQAIDYTPNTSHDFFDAAKEHMTLNPGNNGQSLISVGKDGDLTVTGGESFHQAIVNGKALEAGEKVSVKPGDTVVLRNDVGDRYAVWQNTTLPWTRSLDGTLRLGPQELKPNTLSNLSVR